MIPELSIGTSGSIRMATLSNCSIVVPATDDEDTTVGTIDRHRRPSLLRRLSIIIDLCANGDVSSAMATPTTLVVIDNVEIFGPIELRLACAGVVEGLRVLVQNLTAMVVPVVFPVAAVPGDADYDAAVAVETAAKRLPFGFLVVEAQSTIRDVTVVVRDSSVVLALNVTSPDSSHSALFLSAVAQHIFGVELQLFDSRVSVWTTRSWTVAVASVIVCHGGRWVSPLDSVLHGDSDSLIARYAVACRVSQTRVVLHRAVVDISRDGAAADCCVQTHTIAVASLMPFPACALTVDDVIVVAGSSALTAVSAPFEAVVATAILSVMSSEVMTLNGLLFVATDTTVATEGGAAGTAVLSLLISGATTEWDRAPPNGNGTSLSVASLHVVATDTDVSVRAAQGAVVMAAAVWNCISAEFRLSLTNFTFVTSRSRLSATVGQCCATVLSIISFPAGATDFNASDGRFDVQATTAECEAGSFSVGGGLATCSSSGTMSIDNVRVRASRGSRITATSDGFTLAMGIASLWYSGDVNVTSASFELFCSVAEAGRNLNSFVLGVITSGRGGFLTLQGVQFTVADRSVVRLIGVPSLYQSVMSIAAYDSGGGVECIAPVSFRVSQSQVSSVDSCLGYYAGRSMTDPTRLVIVVALCDADVQCANGALSTDEPVVVAWAVVRSNVTANRCAQQTMVEGLTTIDPTATAASSGGASTRGSVGVLDFPVSQQFRAFLYDATLRCDAMGWPTVESRPQGAKGCLLTMTNKAGGEESSGISVNSTFPGLDTDCEHVVKSFGSNFPVRCPELLSIPVYGPRSTTSTASPSQTPQRGDRIPSASVSSTRSLPSSSHIQGPSRVEDGAPTNGPPSLPLVETPTNREGGAITPSNVAPHAPTSGRETSTVAPSNGTASSQVSNVTTTLAPSGVAVTETPLKVGSLASGAGVSAALASGFAGTPLLASANKATAITRSVRFANCPQRSASDDGWFDESQFVWARTATWQASRLVAAVSTACALAVAAALGVISRNVRFPQPVAVAAVAVVVYYGPNAVGLAVDILSSDGDAASVAAVGDLSYSTGAMRVAAAAALICAAASGAVVTWTVGRGEGTSDREGATSEPPPSLERPWSALDVRRDDGSRRPVDPSTPEGPQRRVDVVLAVLVDGTVDGGHQLRHRSHMAVDIGVALLASAGSTARYQTSAACYAAVASVVALYVAEAAYLVWVRPLSSVVDLSFGVLNCATSGAIAAVALAAAVRRQGGGIGAGTFELQLLNVGAMAGSMLLYAEVGFAALHALHCWLTGRCRGAQQGTVPTWNRRAEEMDELCALRIPVGIGMMPPSPRPGDGGGGGVEMMDTATATATHPAVMALMRQPSKGSINPLASVDV